MTDNSLLRRREQALSTKNTDCNDPKMVQDSVAEVKGGAAGAATTTVPNGTGVVSNTGSSSSSPPTSGGIQQQPISSKPTLVEKAPMRFLIMDAPRQSNLPYYIREMKKHDVTEVVRVCEPTYVPGSEFAAAGICLHEMEYKDGSSPDKELIMSWLRLVEQTCYTGTSNSSPSSSGPCIAVHCVAGLGRAPVMVAIALIEFAGMDSVEAVSFIRNKRRGAINEKQLLYLSGYTKMYRGSNLASDKSSCTCVIL